MCIEACFARSQRALSSFGLRPTRHPIYSKERYLEEVRKTEEVAMRTVSNGMRRFWSLACALFMAMSLAGCDGSSSGYTAGAQATTEEYVNSAADTDAEAREETSKESDEGTMVIKDASVSLRTRSYDAALETVRKIIADADGTPVRSNETGGYGRMITIEARVDPSKIEQAIEQLRSIEGCTVLYANLNSTDVTRTFNDTERRIEILEEQYEHYKTMLEAATTTEDMLLISDRMYDVLAEIKVLTDQRDDMAHDVSRSLLTVSIEEELASGDAGETHDNIYSNAWEDSWGFFGNALQALVLIIIFLVPFALLAAIIVGIVLFIRRKRKSRVSKAPDTTTSEAPEETETAVTPEVPGSPSASDVPESEGDDRSPKPPRA
jgi:hypothetical protein